jgi:hypothetical protein
MALTRLAHTRHHTSAHLPTGLSSLTFNLLYIHIFCDLLSFLSGAYGLQPSKGWPLVSKHVDISRTPLDMPYRKPLFVIVLIICTTLVILVSKCFL